jgi:hypothetical protein
MKNAALIVSLVALGFAACAPIANTRSSTALKFAPVSPLGSSIAGSGSVVVSGDGNTVYRLELQGLPASATLGAGVYVGSCTNQGHLKFALPDVRSDASGNATLETRVVTGNLPAKAYINLHQRTAEQGFGAALSCANIQ